MCVGRSKGAGGADIHGQPVDPEIGAVYAPVRSNRAIIVDAAGQHVRHYGPRQDVIREGDPPRGVNLFLSGWACRYKRLRDGRRQILAVFLPGDLCDHNVFILRKMDHSIAALTAISVVELSRETFDRIALDHPRLLQALWWETLVGAAVQREWTMSLGARDAFERLAHLFCELFLRLRGIGLTDGNSCDLPMTQGELGEAMGMSSVHINRTLQDLRGQNLIMFGGRRLTIPDLPALMQAWSFDPAYLHMEFLAPSSDTSDRSTQTTPFQQKR